MVKIIIDYDNCKGPSCAECVDTCPMAIFDVEDDKIVLENEDICSQCEVCIDICPNDAITIKDE